MNALEKLRSTGRTTRMLKEAKRLADEGRAVYVVTRNQDQARRLIFDFARANGVQPADVGVKIESARAVDLDWTTMRARGAHPNCAFLVDHFAIEEHCAAALVELHRYDEPAMNAAAVRDIAAKAHALGFFTANESTAVEGTAAPVSADPDETDYAAVDAMLAKSPPELTTSIPFTMTCTTCKASSTCNVCRDSGRGPLAKQPAEPTPMEPTTSSWSKEKKGSGW